MWRIVSYFCRVPGPKSRVWDAIRYKKKGYLLTGSPEYESLKKAYFKYKSHPHVRATDWG